MAATQHVALAMIWVLIPPPPSVHLQIDRPWAAAQQALKGSATFIVGRANSVALAPEVDDTVERNPKRRHGGLARLVAPQVGLVQTLKCSWGCLARLLMPPWVAYLPVCLPLV